MQWTLVYHDEFTAWLDILDTGLQDEILAHFELLKQRGPLLGRPYVGTLKGAAIPNLKELRFEYERSPIRILFAFDPKRQAVILLGGNKGANKRWYDVNIPIAERRFRQHLANLEMKTISEKGKEKHD